MAPEKEDRQDKKPIEAEGLEVAEIEDDDLEEVSGGGNSGCTVNYCPQH